nr:retrovirus-related Pol polyprotein from transposon TNT 1-94 [Tanacetum cinerariifolium]
MHNMGKSIGEVHALLIEYEKDLPLTYNPSPPSPFASIIFRSSLELGVTSTSSSFKELLKIIEAKGDGGEGLYVRGRSGQKDIEHEHLKMNCPRYNHKKSQGFVRNEDQVSGSGANGRDCLDDFEKYDGGNVLLGDGRECRIHGTRKVQVQTRDESSFVLDNIMYVSKLRRNLISLGTFEKEDFTVKMQSRKIKRSTQQCTKSGVAKHLGVAGIQQQNGLVKETNATLLAKTPVDMFGLFGWLASIKQGMLEPVKVKCILLGYRKGIVGNKLWRLYCITSKVVLYRNMGFNESGEYKKTCVGSGVGTGSVQVLQRVEFKVEPHEHHTFEVEPHGNVNHVPGSQEVQTQDLIYYHSSLVARYAEFFEKNLITQEVSGRAIDLKEIQDEGTSPSEITSKIPMEVEGFEPPQEEVILIRRSERTHQAPDRLCLNVEVGEHSLGDLNEPASYKAAMLDSESNKWIDFMNVEIQSMIDNMVWVLVDLSPGYQTVGSKWIFKKKTDMDGIVHTYKARLVAKGYTQFYEASGSNATFLILYVDDIIIMGNHITSLQSVKDYLGKCFAMKDLGEATFILGIKIYRDRNIKDMFLVYEGDKKRELRVFCYTDARYLTDADDLKSQSGYVFVLNGGAVDWKSAKQSIFATSSAEAEYIAAFDTSKEAVWVRKFISGLRVVPTIEEPISMYCDNTGSIAIANESGITKGARHFRAK